MSWETVTLGEVCDFQNGFAFKSSLFTDEGLPILRISNIQNQIIDTNNLAYFKIENYKEKLEKYIVEPNDLLIAMSGATTGKIGFNNTNQRFYLNQRVGNLKPKKNLNKKYLYYFLSTQVEKNLSISAGAAQPNLSSEQIKEMLLPLPPLATQQKIVDKLDAIFAEIERATQATLANVKNAEALFQSYLTEVFEKDATNLKKLRDCCQIKPPKSELKNLDKKLIVSFLPMEALGINETEAIPNQTRTLEDVAGSYTYFSEGDVLLAKITPCFENGKLGIATNLSNKIGFGSSEYIVLRPNTDIDKEWIYYYLNRQKFRMDGSSHMSGAVGHKRVTKEFIENSLVPIPFIDTQKKLISTIRKIFQISKSLVLSNDKKLKELTLLKQSILKQAFNGELVKE